MRDSLLGLPENGQFSADKMYSALTHPVEIGIHCRGNSHNGAVRKNHGRRLDGVEGQTPRTTRKSKAAITTVTTNSDLTVPVISSNLGQRFAVRT
jgi:hypothetical protein